MSVQISYSDSVQAWYSKTFLPKNSILQLYIFKVQSLLTQKVNNTSLTFEFNITYISNSTSQTLKFDITKFEKYRIIPGGLYWVRDGIQRTPKGGPGRRVGGQGAPFGGDAKLFPWECRGRGRGLQSQRGR